MSEVCWVSFGPDLEPLEIESRRRADAPEPRRDGLLVAGEAAEVASSLADCSRSGAGWCRLDRVGEDGSREPVHVHAQHVRYVSPMRLADGAAPSR